MSDAKTCVGVSSYACLTMSRRMASASSSSLGKVSPKFANSPYLNSVQPRQSVSSSAQKEKKDKHHAAAKPQEVERQERDRSSNSVVTEERQQPKQSRRRGERRSRSISTRRVPRGSSSVCSYQSIRSSKSRQSSIRSRPQIDILLPSEVEKMLIAFSSKHKNGSHPLLVGKNYSTKQQQHVHDDDSSIASASSYTDSFIYRQCGDEVFSSDLFANMLLARDPDQEGPTLTLGSAAVDGNVSDLEE